MALTLKESQAITEMAKILYNFLPGTPHPYANYSISFAGVAKDNSLNQFWTGGSKLPAIHFLLENTLEKRRDLFCKLIVEVVRKGIIYRQNKGNPVQFEEIKRLNELILLVKFKIPELWNQAFLDTLPSKKVREEKVDQNKKIDFEKLKAD